MSRIAGVVVFTVNGQTLQVVGPLSYQSVTTKIEPLVGQDAYHGESEKPQACWIKAKLRDTGTFAVSSLHGRRGLTCQGQLANGKLVIGQGMTCNISEGVDTNESEFDAEFFSAVVQEIPAAA